MKQHKTTSVTKNIVTKWKKKYSVYLWALSYFKPYLWLLLVIVISGLVVSAVRLSFPRGIQYFIDVIYPQKDFFMFWRLISVISVLVLVMFGVMALQNLFQRSLQERTARDIQFNLFKHLRSMGFSYFEQRPIGESLSFMNTEITSLQTFYRTLFPEMIQRLIFSIISVVLMISLNLKLTLIMIPSLLLYYLVGPYFEKRVAILARENTENRVRYNQKAFESIVALGELRANNAETWDERRFMDKLHSYLETRVKMQWFAYLRGTVRRLSYYIGGLAVIIYGIYLVQGNQLSVGEMIAFLLYYFQIMQIITVIITLITEQKVLMIQADKIYCFIKTQPSLQEVTQPAKLQNLKGEISFLNVSFHYLNKSNVLQHFNLHIEPGERVALVGTSGNGKSTLLKLLLRFYDPQQGQILLDGVPIDQLSFSQLRENIGYVFQETYLFGASVRDNILFGKPNASDEEVIAAAKAAYAHDFIMELSQGYDTLLGERGLKLSGGQKQRISIARMFIKNPTVVLLDEATSALDNVSEREVQSALDHLFFGRTTITVAHRLSTIQDYDKIAVIMDGKIVELGCHSELIQKKGHYYQLAQGEVEKKRDVI